MTDLSAPEAPAAGGPRRTFMRRRKVCPFSGANAPKIDYKDMRLLSRYISERGKILPRRISGNCASHQRALTVAVKRARVIAILPFVAQ